MNLFILILSFVAFADSPKMIDRRVLKTEVEKIEVGTERVTWKITLGLSVVDSFKEKALRFCKVEGIDCEIEPMDEQKYPYKLLLLKGRGKESQLEKMDKYLKLED